MRKNIILFFPAALLLLLTCAAWVFADNRNIYVGDVITLQLSLPANSKFSAEELREQFKTFDIVDIKGENGKYLISLRTFVTGEHKIFLGDKEIVINVKSVLDDIQRESIFEGGTGVTDAGFLFYWRVLFYITAGFFLMSSGFIMIKTLLKGNVKTLSPLQLFRLRSGALSTDDDSYFVDLTFYFKEYLECLYQCRIIGKTSSEIMIELKGINYLDTMLSRIREWLTECDRLKFTGVKVSAVTKEEHYSKLLELVEKIDTQQNEDIKQ